MLAVGLVAQCAVALFCEPFYNKRAILRGILSDRAKIGFVSQFYIYLENTITEFFCNLSVPF